MSASVTTDILNFIEETLGVAQIGLTYSTDAFDIARFHRLRASAAALLGRLEGVEVEKLGKWIAYDEHYATPKLDVRALVYDAQGCVLLVQEKSDELWTLPGGWCDMGESPSASAVREVEEETGLQVEAVRLVALFDKLKHGHPPQIPHAYKCFFHCIVTGGEIRPETDETLACGFFPVDGLPALSLHRVTEDQIVSLSRHVARGGQSCLFD
ncbi:NUDIX hydrolase N-terminal domain-containing protein [Achromobacter agilis]|uniref:RNA pyrophosphohydrolase n=1 Tax=Achromobacter agilis TaxID=1353888 RepID=A0A446CHZ1_9BURK|nr:NUDIX hydrolase N-terminal domain-containing protein [Achromobacter agilis]SSW67489.1 RNA pyrophosphohydrolase [Achromobacter agilis]